MMCSWLVRNGNLVMGGNQATSRSWQTHNLQKTVQNQKVEFSRQCFIICGIFVIVRRFAINRGGGCILARQVCTHTRVYYCVVHIVRSQ